MILTGYVVFEMYPVRSSEVASETDCVAQQGTAPHRTTEG